MKSTRKSKTAKVIGKGFHKGVHNMKRAVRKVS